MSRSLRSASILFCLLLAACVAAQAATVTFDSSPLGPITNIDGSSGEVVGNEWSTLGVLFTPATGDALDIGCSFPNCLGASLATGSDFDGTLSITFLLGASAASVDSLSIAFCCAGNTGLTHAIVRDANGNVILNQTGMVGLTLNQSGIASATITFGFDAMNSVTFGNLSPIEGNAVPEPATFGLLGPAFVAAGLMLSRLRKR